MVTGTIPDSMSGKAPRTGHFHYVMFANCCLWLRYDARSVILFPSSASSPLLGTHEGIVVVSFLLLATLP